MSESPREATPETNALILRYENSDDEDAFSQMADGFRILECRLYEAQRENIEHAITQVKATRIIRELDAKLAVALREIEEYRTDMKRWKAIPAEKGKP